MISYQENASALASRVGSCPPAQLQLLAPAERHAPIAILTPAKRTALVVCFHAGVLQKKDGAWHGIAGSTRLAGITIADLARDGMLTLMTNDRVRSARLTERGNWFARTLLQGG
jgi:hypothetical protein